MTDRQLLTDYVQKGSEEAFAQLVDRHAGRVYSTCLRVLGEPHAAEDATQAAFAILARKARGLSASTVLSGWLFVVARRAALSLRKRAAARARREKEAARMREREKRGASDSWDRVRPQLDAALAALPASQREVVLLRHYYGRSEAEAAEELGWGRSRVSVTLSRAMNRLRAILGRRGASVSTAVLASMLAGPAVKIAPAGLAAAITATVTGGAALSPAAAGAMSGALKAMFLVKLKLAVAAACAAAVVAAGGGLAVRELTAGEDRVAAAAPAGNHGPNPRLAALPEATWVKVAPQVPAPQGIMAYSGAVFNPDANCLMLFGGGHGDYWGNEVWTLSMGTLEWKRMYEPSKYGKLDNDRGCVVGEDRPYTRHSYDNMVYVPKTKEMLMWGGFGPTCYPRKFGGNLADETGPRRGGVSPQPIDVWTYSLERNKWKPRFNLAYNRENARKAPNGPNGGTAWDSKRQLVWAVKGAGAIWSFDLNTDKWTRNPVALPGNVSKKAQTAYGSLVYLAGRDALMSASGWTFKLGPKITAERLPAVGELGAEKRVGGGICLLSDREVPFGVTIDLRTRYFDFGKKKWLDAPATIQGGKDLMLNRWKRNGYIKGIYGRLRWAPVDGVVIMTIHGGTWAYRPPKALGRAAR
ncbi:MAG: RNA polymerase sigma factor [Planctomycetota bacterium]